MLSLYELWAYYIVVVCAISSALCLAASQYVHAL